jgi:ATP-dependent Clp protease ATP-binding subunit ClpC
MFERFTESAREAIVLAQEEALALKHGHVGAEHLLLGLARETHGGAARALTAAGATPPALKAAVLETVGEGGDADRAQTPFTPDAKRALELALNESRALGYSYIATEHLLLGLLSAQTEVVDQVLAGVRVSPLRVREETLRILEDTKPLQEPGRRARATVTELEVGASARAKEIWLEAAARAAAQERYEVTPADLLEPLLSDPDVVRLLAEAGCDAGALLAALRGAGGSP